MIDTEVRKLVESQFDRAKDLLKEHRDKLDILARTLLEKEVLVKSDVELLIGPRPFPEKPTHPSAPQVAPPVGVIG